jgi:integrase
VRPIRWRDHRLPKDERAPTIWTIEEARRALALLATRNRDVADAVELSIYTGMRRNELATLTPARINLTERICVVLAKRKARQGHRERRVYLNTPAVALLAERIRPGMDPQAPLFTLANVRKLWDWVRNEIGRPDVRWHDLRHTHGTLLGRATQDPRIVQRSLGHTHLQTSLIYMHTDQAAVVEAVETIPALTSRKVVGL